jgi:hypothetical protein
VTPDAYILRSPISLLIDLPNLCLQHGAKGLVSEAFIDAIDPGAVCWSSVFRTVRYRVFPPPNIFMPISTSPYPNLRCTSMTKPFYPVVLSIMYIATCRQRLKPPTYRADTPLSLLIVPLTSRHLSPPCHSTHPTHSTVPAPPPDYKASWPNYTLPATSIDGDTELFLSGWFVPIKVSKPTTPA